MKSKLLSEMALTKSYSRNNGSLILSYSFINLGLNGFGSIPIGLIFLKIVNKSAERALAVKLKAALVAKGFHFVLSPKSLLEVNPTKAPANPTICFTFLKFLI